MNLTWFGGLIIHEQFYRSLIQIPVYLDTVIKDIVKRVFIKTEDNINVLLGFLKFV